MSEEKGYYDIDIDLDALLKNYEADTLFYMKDLLRRKFTLNDNVDQSTVADICRHIMQINREDADIPNEKRRPILLYICSNGGSVPDGYELIDVIEASQTPVYTIVMGYAYSMGLLISLAGHRRFSMPNATFLMHDGSNFIWDSGSKAQDQAEFNKRLNKRIRDYILSHSKLSPETYDANLRVEWFMFADEALENGFVDEIVGVSTDIYSVV